MLLNIFCALNITKMDLSSIIRKHVGILQRLLEQDYLVYTKIFPEGDGKYNVVKILSIYRPKFHALDLLFDSAGAASLISIESALNFINERINDEN